MKPSRTMPAPPMVEEDRFRRAIEEALPIARDRKSLLDEIRGALERGEEQLALALTRRLVGLPPAQAK